MRERRGGTRPRGKNLVLSAKIVHLCSSALFLLCGILVMFVTEYGNAGDYLLAIASIVIGGAGIYGYFSNDMYRLAFQSDFALGIFNIIFGTLLIFLPARLTELLPCAIGIITILDAGNKSQISIEGFRFGMHKWFLVLISAVAEAVLGVAVIISLYREADVAVLMGAAMSVVGAVNFWTTMYTVRVRDTVGGARQEERD